MASETPLSESVPSRERRRGRGVSAEFAGGIERALLGIGLAAGAGEQEGGGNVGGIQDARLHQLGDRPGRLLPAAPAIAPPHLLPLGPGLDRAEMQGPPVIRPV